MIHSLYAKLLLVLSFFTFFSSVTTQGTCSPSSPCKSGCCGSSGFCGFGPTYCGSGNCTSSCSAQAECGQYAPAGKSLCPLNVCCSQFGFCGTTSEFCGTGCQNGCNAVQKPSCSGGSTTNVRIGYYESWSMSKSCDQVPPSMINAAAWTHINYAFALIDPVTFQVAQMNTYDLDLYSQVTGLKHDNPSLKVYISIGGWDAGGAVFSAMCSSSANRAAFINSLLSLMKTYAFDGVDLDWEYPGAADRGGTDADFANLTTFMAQLKSSLGGYGVTMTLPSSYWYLQHFDVVGLQKNVDWFNFMSYDIHGTWDGNNPFTTKTVAPHTNLTEIDQGLSLLWRNNIPPSKVVLGLGFYGRSFTLSNPSCNTPGCAFASGGTAGSCTNASGILSDAEIQRVIKQYDLNPILDAGAGVKYMSWNSDQWVSYDDAERDTIKLKMQYANSLCLAGTMVWALDLDPNGFTSLAYFASQGKGNNFNNIPAQQLKAYNTQASGQYGVVWSPCLNDKDRKCPFAYTEIGMVGHGKVFDADRHATSKGCSGKQNRVLCIPNSMIVKGCTWFRDNKGGKICDGHCPVRTFLLSQNDMPAGDKTACKSGTYVPICCSSWSIDGSICPATPFETWYTNQLGGSGTFATYTFGDPGVAKWDETKALALRSKGELSKRQLGYPVYFPGCNGPDGTFPVNGDWVPVDLDFRYTGWQGYGDPTYSSPAPKPTDTTTIYESETTCTNTQTKTCPGDRYPQACLHYSSVQSRNPGFRVVSCVANNFRRGPQDISRGEIPSRWYTDHGAKTGKDNPYRRDWVTKRYLAPYIPGPNNVIAPDCQVDEWPPYALFQGQVYGVRVRWLPGGQNGGVANWGDSNWKLVCQFPAPVRTGIATYSYQLDFGYAVKEYWKATESTIVGCMTMSFINMPSYPGDPWGLDNNACFPSALAPQVESGFPLYRGDEFYVADQLRYGAEWYTTSPIPSWVTIGKTKPTKRWLQLPFFGEAAVNGSAKGNSSHVPNWDELQDRLEVVVYPNPWEQEPASVQAETTAVLTTLEVLATEQSPSRPTSSVHVPQSTASVIKSSKTTIPKGFATPVPTKKVRHHSKRKHCEQK